MIAKRCFWTVLFLMSMNARALQACQSCSYHAMSYPAWLLDKLTVGHGHVVMWVISSVALFAIWVAVYIRLRRQKRIMLAEYIVISVIITSAVLLGDVVMWVISSAALFAIWVGVYIRRRRQKRIMLAEYIVISVIITSAVLLGVYHFGKEVTTQFGGHIDVTVDSKPGEAYEEYLQRVRQLNGYDYCPNCGKKMFRSREGNWICDYDKCDYIRRARQEMGGKDVPVQHLIEIIESSAKKNFSGDN